MFFVCLFFPIERVVIGCHHQKAGKNVALDGVKGQWVNYSQKMMAIGLNQMGFLKEGRKEPAILVWGMLRWLRERKGSHAERTASGTGHTVGSPEDERS